ncbi:unnamed protein product, partial [Hymenolepis diminuta]
ECTNEDNYNNFCKLGAGLTWLGTLAFVGLIFFTFFGCIIVKMEKEIEDLTTKNNLLSNSDHAITSSAARVSAETSDSEKHLTISSTASIDEIRPGEMPKTVRSNIPPKVRDFGKA